MATIRQIKKRNKQARYFWFSEDTTRFFKTQLSSQTFDRDDGTTLFVSSEQFVDSQNRAKPRRYTVRIAHVDGSIGTYSKFQEYKTLAQALAAAKLGAEGTIQERKEI